MQNRSLGIHIHQKFTGVPIDTGLYYRTTAFKLSWQYNIRHWLLVSFRYFFAGQYFNVKRRIFSRVRIQLNRFSISCNGLIFTAQLV